MAPKRQLCQRITNPIAIDGTTATLKHAQLQQLSDEVGPSRSLLVVCSAFRGRKEGYDNLTVKKYPEWHGEHHLPNDRCGIILLICRHMLRRISTTSHWHQRVESLLEEYPDIPRRPMGLPDNWTTHPIWTGSTS